MRFRALVTALALGVAASLLAVPAQGQIVKKLKKAAAEAVEGEVLNQTDRLIRDAIRCRLDDPACIEKAQTDGEDVIFVDDDGEIIVDDEGAPITDPDEAAKQAGVEPHEEDRPARPGEGVWANYDFVPGETVLFYEDYENDEVGDFPRRLEFLRGNWEIVEWEGHRLLRNTGPRFAALKIVLPRELPESFTIELDAHFTHTNHQMIIATTAPKAGAYWTSLEGNFFQIGVAHGTGVATRVTGGAESTNRSVEVEQGVVPIRIMVDGRYAKVYVQERRVANIPNADFPRSAEIYIANIYSGSEENPLYLGPIRIAEGGRNLYDKLAEDGRVATQGILFATHSDRIRPESTPTLEEIGTMLEEHPDLRISIEGHTDADGDESHNQELSGRRAEAVKAFLVEQYGIDASRLETTGFGEAQPAADNETPEGKQQNRRVELVRLPS